MPMTQPMTKILQAPTLAMMTDAASAKQRTYYDAGGKGSPAVGD